MLSIADFGVIHANIAIYALAFWLVSPVLPLLQRELGIDLLTIGFLESAFNACQLLGSPLVGYFADWYGAWATLALTQAAGGLSYLLAGLAPSVVFVAASKLPASLQHAMQAAQAAIAHSTPPHARAKRFGQLSVSYGVGFVAGPLLGGVLAEAFGNAAVVLVAAALSFVVAIVTFLAGRRHDAAPAAPAALAKDSGASSRGAAKSSRSAIALLRQNSSLCALLALLTLVNIAMGVFRSNFSVAAADHFRLAPSATGRLLSGMGVVGMIINAFVVGLVTDNLHPRTIVPLCLGLMATGFCALTLAQNELHLLAAIGPILVASTVLRTIFLAFVTASVPVSEAGVALGLAHASSSLAGIVAPTMAATLYQQAGYPAITLTVAAGLAASFCVFELLRARGIFSETLLYPVSDNKKDK